VEGLRHIRLWDAPFGPAAGNVAIRGLVGSDLLLIQEGQGPPAVLSLHLAKEVVAELDGADTVADIAFGDLQRILTAAYAQTFGARPELVANCPDCGVRCELRPDLNAILDTAPTAASASVTIPDGAGTWSAHLRAPRASDMAECACVADGETAAAFLLDRIVSQISGPDGSVAEASELPEPVRVMLDTALAEANAGGQILINAICPDCARSLCCHLDPLALLRRQAEFSGDILVDVARLAAAFGWSAPQILALPHRHRRRLLKIATAGDAA